MISDIYGARHTTEKPAALACYERAVHCFAAHQPFLPHLSAALAHDPSMVAAHALTGIAHALIGREHAMTVSRALLAKSTAALQANRGGTPHEQALAAAHQQAASGRLTAAAALLEQHLVSHPTDLLALKLAHALRFMSGDAHRMLMTSAAALESWSEAMPGFGFVLGCRAFALEETGQLREAETAGRRAVMHEPEDVWALHAVAHVLEMDNRTREGRILLEPTRQCWTACGGFGQHLIWHLALFHLNEADHARALALYDEAITPSVDGCFRDMANAVSLLWRLEQENVDVGDRWHHVHAIAHERRLDATYAFGSLHYLLAMIASADASGAQDVIAAMRRHGQSGRGDQAAVITRVALPLAEALFAGATKGSTRITIEIANGLRHLGGSRAQRDVFLRTLMLGAADEGDHAMLAALSSLRRLQRQNDRFTEIVRLRASSKHVARPLSPIHLQEAV